MRNFWMDILMAIHGALGAAALIFGLYCMDKWPINNKAKRKGSLGILAGGIASYCFGPWIVEKLNLTINASRACGAGMGMGIITEFHIEILRKVITNFIRNSLENLKL